jgi:hypothetical protein
MRGFHCPLKVKPFSLSIMWGWSFNSTCGSTFKFAASSQTVRWWCSERAACQQTVLTVWKWSNRHPSLWSHWSARHVSDGSEHSTNVGTDFIKLMIDNLKELPIRTVHNIVHKCKSPVCSTVEFINCVKNRTTTWMCSGVTMKYNGTLLE